MIACYDCKDRYPACQSKCEIGKAYAEKRRKQNEIIRKERDRENVAEEAKFDAMLRMKRGKRRREAY